MKIFVINNLDKPRTFVCDDQTTIDAAPIVTLKDGTTKQLYKENCVVGTQTDADNILANRQKALLDQNAGLFVVNLEVLVDGGVKWPVVDLATESPNTTNVYCVLDPVTGNYTQVTGLDAANALLAQVKQNYLTFCGIGNYTIWTEWPTPRLHPIV